MFSVITATDRIIRFTFGHEHYPTPKVVNQLRPKHRASGHTWCRLAVENAAGVEQIADKADAYSSSHDHFSREVGRKAALTRVLQKLDLSKAERELVWKRYFNRDFGNKAFEVYKNDLAVYITEVDRRYAPVKWFAKPVMEPDPPNAG